MFRPKIRFTHDEIRVLVFALNELRNTPEGDFQIHGDGGNIHKRIEFSQT